MLPIGGPVADRREPDALSSSLCREALTALDRIFALEIPDEPDLGLNITYWHARAALLRLARAEPWRVSRRTVHAIRHLLAEVGQVTDPQALEAQLEAVPRHVIELLDRRRPHRGLPLGGHRRRASDRSRSVPSTALGG